MSGISVSHLRSFFNKKSYNMKLHLPKGLRTALLAVIGTAAVYTTTSQAAPAAAYESTYTTQIQIRENIRNNSAPATAAGNFDFRDPETGKAYDFNKTDWGLTLDILNYSPSKVNNDFVGGEPLTNSGCDILERADSVTLSVENSFAFFISNMGRVRVITNSGEDSLANDILLFKVDRDWVNNKDEEKLNIRLSFSWDADGGLPDLYNMPNHYGALIFNGAYMLDSLGNIVEKISSYYDGAVILDSYEMPSDLLSVQNGNQGPTDGGGMYPITGQGTSVMVTLNTPGEETAWAIRGTTNLNYLLNNAYYTDATTGAKRSYKTNEMIEFRGGYGILYLESGQTTYNLPTRIGSDPGTAGQTPTIGFGANTGAKLTVSAETLNTTLFTEGCSLRAIGAGTVILQVDTTATGATTVALTETGTDTTTPGGATEGGTTAGGTDGEGSTDTPPAGGEGDGGVVGGEGTVTPEPDPDLPVPVIPVKPTLVSGPRTINFAQIGDSTTVKLDVTGNSAVTVKLGTAEQVGANASIIKTKTSGDGNLIVDLNGSDGKVATTYIGTLSNENGNLDIDGKQVLETTDADGNKETETVYAQLGAKKLKASRDVNIEARVRVSESITAGGHVTIKGSATEAGSIDAGGNLDVESGTQLIVDGKATVGQSANINGQAKFGSLVLTNTDPLVNHVNIAEGSKLVAGSVTAQKIFHNKADTTPICNIVYDGTNTAQVIMKDGVVIDDNGIQAGTISEETRIALNGAAKLTAGTMNGTGIYLGALNGGIYTMNNVKHSDGVIEISSTGTIATGNMSATCLDLQPQYYLKVKNLDITPSTTDGGALTATGIKTKGHTTIRNAEITDTKTTAESIKAREITIEPNTELTSGELTATDGAITIGMQAKVSGGIMDAKRGVTMEAGSKLRDSVVKSSLTTNGLATLSNVVLEEEWKTNTGTVTMDNVAIAPTNNAFGGTNGDAFQADDTVNNITLSGTLTTAANAVTLNATAASINAKNLTFSEAGDTFTILKSNGTNTVTGLDDASKIDLDVAAYTWAKVKTEGNKIVITGNKDEEGIKADLADTEARKDAMEAIESATMAEGGVLTDLHDAMGDVLHKSNEQRQEILDAISGASTTALADSQRRGIMEVQGNLRNRIVQMGGNADWETAGIQAWAQADASFSSSDSGDDGPGYDYNTWGATVGANVDLSETVTVGMSFSASYGELDVDSADNASGNNDAYYVNLFARHQSGRWMQMLIFTAGMNDMDLERNVNGYTGEGSTDGTSFSAYYELGYTLGLNDEFTHILQPMVNARISSAKVDGYTEKGSIGDAALEYDGDSYVYGSVGIGVRYQGVIYESVYERNAVLELRAQVTQDFGDCTDEAGVRIGDGDLFTVTGTDTTGTGFDIGAGISAPIGLQTTLFADADVSIRPDYTGFRANVGLRYDF